jgi:MFS family permease
VLSALPSFTYEVVSARQSALPAGVHDRMLSNTAKSKRYSQRAASILTTLLPRARSSLLEAGLVAGLALLLIAMAIPSFVWFLIGTVFCGVGVGLSFMGSLALLNGLAPPDRRGEVLSSYFAVAYVGLTVPVIGLGVTSDYVGAFVATLAFAVVVGVLALIVAALNARPTPQ